jgi:hypothetical protein
MIVKGCTATFSCRGYLLQDMHVVQYTWFLFGFGIMETISLKLRRKPRCIVISSLRSLLGASFACHGVVCFYVAPHKIFNFCKYTSEPGITL